MQCNEHESSQYRMMAATQSQAARSSYCLGPSGEWISRPNGFMTPIIVPVLFPYCPPAPPPPKLLCPPKPPCHRRRRRPRPLPLGGSFFFPGGRYNSSDIGYGRTEKEDWNRHGLRQKKMYNSLDSTTSLDARGAYCNSRSVDGECSGDGSDEDYSECSGSESDRDEGWKRPTHY